MNMANNLSKLENKYEDFKRINLILEKIERLSNDFDYANHSTDELYIYQPFLLSVMMGYKFDLKADELEEALALYTVIWEYFKIHPKVKTSQVTENQFEHFQDLNIKMLNKADPTELEKTTILQAVLFEKFRNRPALMNMETQTKAALMIGIKTMIDCFEDLTK